MLIEYLGHFNIELSGQPLQDSMWLDLWLEADQSLDTLDHIAIHDLYGSSLETM